MLHYRVPDDVLYVMHRKEYEGLQARNASRRILLGNENFIYPRTVCISRKERDPEKPLTHLEVLPHSRSPLLPLVSRIYVRVLGSDRCRHISCRRISCRISCRISSRGRLLYGCWGGRRRSRNVRVSRGWWQHRGYSRSRKRRWLRRKKRDGQGR